MNTWVGRSSSFWLKKEVHCAKHQQPGGWVGRCISWKLRWLEDHGTWTTRRWCTTRWTFIFGWSKSNLCHLPHHVEHCLVVQVIQKPDAWLTGIFLEGNRVAIDDLYMLIMCIALIFVGIPRRAPTTRLFLCLRLTLLKWSTMDNRTRGCTLAWVAVGLLI